METVQAKFDHYGDNGEPYYRTLPNGQLIVLLGKVWYHAIDDNCWEEPSHPIPDGYEIEKV